MYRNPFGYQPWREQRTFQAGDFPWQQPTVKASLANRGLTQSMFDILESDIVVMQETKIQRKDLQDDMVLVPGWDVFFSLPKYKRGTIHCFVPRNRQRTLILTLFGTGYSGVAIYTRNATCAPLRAEEGVTGVLCPPRSTTSFRDLPSDQQIGGYPRPGQLSGAVEEAELDSEGRCVILEFPAFVLLGVYSPANRDESRDVFRTSFFEALDVRIRNLVSMGKEVILTGDLNVIRSEMDSTNVLETLRKEDMTLEEWVSLPTRRLFNQLIFEGSVVGERDEERQEPVLWDLCRNFHPTRLGMNTCWDTKRNTRPANNGSRIDYILCSNGIKDWFTFANIQEGLMGSDHCPVFATIADRVRFKGNDTALLDVMNPPGVYAQGKRVRELAQRDLLPLSAKLIPEFDRRQSIRDMFFKKSSSIGVAADGAPSPGQPAKRAGSITETGLRSASNNNSSNNTDRNGTSEALPGGASANSRAANAQQAESQKRPAEPIDPAPRQLKRSKPGADTNSSKPKTAPGQKTLKGFFKPVDSAAVHPTPSGLQESQTNNTSPRTATDSTSPTKSASGEPVGSELTSPSPKYSQSNRSEPISRLPDRVFDPIEAKESWSKLLGKRVVPRCEHEEPCISLVTKKPGVNRGMSVPP